jgi:type VI secretion system secreted protein Hcp
MPDIFLKLDPLVEGGSQHSKFAKQIEVESFSWGVSNPPFDGKTDLPAVQQDLHISAIVDRQSPKLFEACAKGTHFNTAEVSVVEEGGDQPLFYKVVLSEVVLTSYQVSASARAGDPMESFGLSFRTLTNEFRAQKADGSLEPPIVGSFDFGDQKKL